MSDEREEQIEKACKLATGVPLSEFKAACERLFGDKRACSVTDIVDALGYHPDADARVNAQLGSRPRDLRPLEPEKDVRADMVRSDDRSVYVHPSGAASVEFAAGALNDATAYDVIVEIAGILQERGLLGVSDFVIRVDKR